MDDLSYEKVDDIVIDIVSRNLNIRHDELDLDAEIIKDLGATLLCFLNIFIEITKVFELPSDIDFKLQIKTVNDLILCINNNCDFVISKAKQIIAQYRKISFSNVNLDELFEDDAFNYTEEQKSLIKLLINELGSENFCMLDCFGRLELNEIQTILFDKSSCEEKKNDLIRSLIKSVGIENLCLLYDLSDLILEDIKEIIQTKPTISETPSCEEKKDDLIRSLIKSIGIENLCLLDDLSDLTLEDIKEIIYTNKETS